jgi:acyl dehydratase
MAAVGRTAIAALKQRLGGGVGTPGAFAVPGPALTAEVPPPSPALVRDYLRSVGGDPAAYRSRIPAHLFPQWTFPLVARTLDGLPYPLLRVVNGGCRLTMNAPLPAGEALAVRAQLVGVEDKGRHVVLHQRVATGPAARPDALVADIYAIVPTGAAADGAHHKNGANGANGVSNGSNGVHAGNGANGAKKDVALVPPGARELGFWRLPADAGLSFALLTGDINPVHWLRPYAQAFGFRSSILHGFATLARAVEGLQRALFAGAVDRLTEIDVRFARPLPLPARVGLYVAGGGAVFVGDAPGGFAYLTGKFGERTIS